MLHSFSTKLLCEHASQYLTNAMFLHSTPPSVHPLYILSEEPQDSFCISSPPHRNSPEMSSNPSHPHGHGYGQRSSAGHPGYAQSNEEVAAWINALSSQEHALDPRIYSDGQHPQQYVAGGYPSGGYPAGSVAPGAYPPSSYPATATYSTTPQQYPSGYYHPPYPAGSYPAAFQQGASGMQPYAPQMAQQQPPRQHQYQMQPQQQYQQQYSPSFDAGMGEEYDDYSASESESTEAGRARSRIPLDPNQPLTVEGRQRERVNVACDRWYVLPLSIPSHLPSTRLSATYRSASSLASLHLLHPSLSSSYT